MHPGTGELLGARYLGARQEIRALDPYFRDGAATAGGAHRRRPGSCLLRSLGAALVVDCTHDRDPGITWFYDHTTGTARRLFRPYRTWTPRGWPRSPRSPSQPATVWTCRAT
ncbi:hypothetical protein GCM10017691_11500 [Pseudonocardia petroleophila]